MIRQHLTRRNLVRAGVYGGLSAGVAGTLFAPRGLDVRDGRHDRGENGLWLQHGWLGDDVWFAQNGGEEKKQRLRSDEALAELGARLSRHGIRDLFPHLCPAQPDGSILPVDVGATTRFARALPERRILPWIGGVLDVHVFPDTPRWRETFVASAVRLLHRRGELAGLHLNVEPCPSGHRGFLLLLDELRAAMPAGRLLSVAAYPPKTWLHPFADVHWEEPYYREVAARCDQLTPMLYDTALRFPMLYRGLLSRWVTEVLSFAQGTPTLLGLPAYEDAGVGYHDPTVENLEHSLAGIHAGLSDHAQLPEAYRGVAVYCDWEMNAAKWQTWEERFSAPAGTR